MRTLKDCPKTLALVEEQADAAGFVEVACGVRKLLQDCTLDDVAGMVEVGHEMAMNHEEIASLLERVLAEGVEVPAHLRTLPDGEDLPAIIAHRDGLRRLVGTRGAQ